MILSFKKHKTSLKKISKKISNKKIKGTLIGIKNFQTQQKNRTININLIAQRYNKDYLHIKYLKESRYTSQQTIKYFTLQSANTTVNKKKS